MKIDLISDAAYAVSGIRVEHIAGRNFCVFDVEATGPDEKEDCITQIGAVLLDPLSKNVIATYETLVQPPKPIPKLIERLTGIHNHDVKTAPKLSDIYGEFADFVQDAVLVTQAGYEYDWPLLYHECRRNGLNMLSNPILDTKALFSYLFPEIDEIISTDFLLSFFSIDASDLKRHTALDDSLLIKRIFDELLKELEQRNINDIIIDQPIPIQRVKLPKLASP